MASDRNGAGASSISFWLRRCSEQSRVPIALTSPCVSARICTSTWRGRSRNRSRKQSPLPNATSASRVADSNASSTSSSRRTTLRPRPPPPCTALRASGRPCSLAKRTTSLGSCTGTMVPGAMGAPTSAAMRRASTLSPRMRMVCGLGPIQTSPASSTAWAKSVFSERNP